MKFLLTILWCVFTFALMAQESDTKIIRKADSLSANYQFEQALAVLSQGDTTNIAILLRLGNCNFRLGVSRAAIRPYEKVLSMDSTNLLALNQLGQLYARDGDLNKSLETYMHLIKLDSANSYYYKQVASAASRLENKIMATLFYSKALRLNPKDVEASLAYGNVLMDLEQFQEVDSVVARIIATDPQSKSILMLKARSAFEQRNNEVVITTINKLLEKSDTTITYARMLGVSYFNLKEYKQVMTCMHYLQKNRFEGESLYYYLGVASRELGMVPASIEYFKMAVQKSVSENIVSYYTQLGQSYEAIGNHRLAINAYRSAYNYSSQGILLYHLARNYDMSSKDKSKAIEYYKKYLASSDTTRVVRDYAKRRMQDMGHF